MRIALILGSMRAERISDRPAYYLRGILEGRGHEIVTLDLRELRLPLFDDSAPVHENVTRFIQNIVESDAIVIVTPENNHSITAALKNAIDYLRHREFMHKPVGLIGVSDALVGGARAIYEMRASFPTLGAVILPTVVAIPETQHVFPDAQTCTSEKVAGQLNQLVKEIEAYGPALSTVRASF